jgi:uncharacterized membrane protein YgaE (UPF0421/DUF939 family)
MDHIEGHKSGRLIFKNLAIERVIHSIKTALAIILGLVIIRFINWQGDQWLVITVAVVMCAQVNVGSVMHKSYMRFVGTITGSIIAGLTLSLFGHDTSVYAIVITLSSILFSYIATSDKTYSDSGTLGVVTVIVILLGQHPSVTTAMQRCLEISIGILLATLVSQFVLPIRARDHLNRTQVQTLRKLNDFYQNSLMKDATPEVIARYQELDESIVKSLSSQRSLAKEARREYFGKVFDPAIFTQILRCEKEVFRSIVCMHYAYEMLPGGKNTLAKLPAVQTLHDNLCQALEKISLSLDQQDFIHNPVTIPSLQPVKNALREVKQTISSEDVIYVNGFLFCAEILIVHLTELVILLEKSQPPSR